jgi:hypothetical protein
MNWLQVSGDKAIRLPDEGIAQNAERGSYNALTECTGENNGRPG